jgi:hypothetical protein
MNRRRQDLVQAVRRRTIEIMLTNDVDFPTAERRAAAEIKAIAKARTSDPIAQLSRSLSPPGGARARLGAALSAIAARASAAATIIPRALSATTGVVRTAGAAIPGASVSTQPPVPAEPSSSGVLGVFAGNSPTGATRIDHEFPVHPAVANWHTSLERNRRGGSSS